MTNLNDLAAKLATKAAEAHDSGDAMRFSQATNNITNAAITLDTINRNTPPYETDVKTMVDRFLTWKLPEDFYPDGGVTFDRGSPHEAKREPVGTNLLTATQAEAMIRHILGH
jgi:hypothetical protein